MLEKISRYRTELMGFAIIWVILFHSGISIPILRNLCSIGYGGVDIFLFLSGFGLYFSFKKSSNVLHFYKNRCIRIFPTYALIVLISMIIMGAFSISQFLLNTTTIGFWIGKGYFEWYIPALVMFYLLFPLLFKLVNKNLAVFLLIVVSVTAALALLRINLNIKDTYMLFITRIPIFSLGVLWGKWTFNKKQLTAVSKGIIYVSFVIGLMSILFFTTHLPVKILWGYGVYWYPFILITPGLCAFVATALDVLHRAIINKVLAFCGTVSLELYLLHLKLFENSNAIAKYFDVPKPVVLLAVIILIIPVSMLISKLM